MHLLTKKFVPQQMRIADIRNNASNVQADYIIAAVGFQLPGYQGIPTT